MSAPEWIDAALVSARPQAVAALLRYFRDLDVAEEAFQDACLRALRNWPRKGPPRDPVAWLIFVGRNAALDLVRRRRRQQELPPEEALSDLSDTESELVQRLDEADFRDDLLRLLFVCCHPGLQPAQQIALALRIVSGLSVQQIARAFLVSEAAMEQRITRAKSRIGTSSVPFEAPSPGERIERLAAVATMLYLLFNEGYSSSGPADIRNHLCGEAIRLTRLLLRLFPGDPEMSGLTALMLLQHSRSAARAGADGNIVLLEEQDRDLWDRAMIEEGLALLDGAVGHARPGPYQVQAAIAALHSRASSARETDWSGIERLYATLERMQPSPVVTLNRSVAVAKVRGPSEALSLIEPLARRLAGYFHFHAIRGAYLRELGREDDAREAFQRAIGLAGSAAEAAHIRQHLDQLVPQPPAASRSGTGAPQSQ